MKHRIKKYLIPHKGNDHKPDLLTGRGAVVATFIAVLVFGFSTFHTSLLKNSLDFLAAIAPSVLVDLTNADRLSLNVGTLRVSPTLQQAAQLKANDMAEKGYFAHTSPEGISPWYWFNQAGYKFKYAGENLAVNFIDSADVARAWMESPTHRANIVNDNFTEIGIASAEGEFNGRHTVFVVQLFGTQAITSSLPPRIVQLQSQTIVTEDVAPAKIQEQALPREDIFVAVEDTSAVKAAEITTETFGDSQPVTSEASLWDKIISQPSLSATFVYYILGILVAVVVILSIIIKIKKQHTRSLLYGILIILIILLLLSLSGFLRVGDLLIL